MLRARVTLGMRNSTEAHIINEHRNNFYYHWKVSVTQNTHMHAHHHRITQRAHTHAHRHHYRITEKTYTCSSTSSSAKGHANENNTTDTHLVIIVQGAAAAAACGRDRRGSETDVHVLPARLSEDERGAARRCSGADGPTAEECKVAD